MQTVSQVAPAIQPKAEADREIQELKDKVEQAVVCLNAALYVLLQRTETEKLNASKAEIGHE